MLLSATVFDWTGLVIGGIGGLVLTVIGFMLTYRSSWRNLLTRELSVTIKSNTAELHGNDFAMIKFNYLVNCTHDEEISINRMFLRLRHGLRSNTPPNATVGEMFFGDDGKYHLLSKPVLFRFNIEDDFTLRDQVLMTHINEGLLSNLTLVIDTNKYGEVVSNKIALKHIKGRQSRGSTSKSMSKIAS